MTINSLIEPIFLANDLAKELGPKGIALINQILWVSYGDYVSQLSNEDRLDLVEQEEDFITDQWFYHILSNWQKENRAIVFQRLNVLPVTQLSDTSQKTDRKSPSIDVCFRTWDGPTTSSRYIAVECKKINLKKSQMIKRYCETGINHFISGYYGSTSSISMMAGYILHGDIPSIVSKIEEVMKSVSDEKAMMLRDKKFLEPQYYSNHVRNDSVSIEIKHLLLDFAPI